MVVLEDMLLRDTLMGDKSSGHKVFIFTNVDELKPFVIVQYSTIFDEMGMFNCTPHRSRAVCVGSPGIVTRRSHPSGRTCGCVSIVRPIDDRRIHLEFDLTTEIYPVEQIRFYSQSDGVSMSNLWTRFDINSCATGGWVVRVDLFIPLPVQSNSDFYSDANVQ